MGRDQVAINAGQEDEMSIVGYRQVRWKLMASWVVTVLTVGVLQLFYYWRPEWKIETTCNVTSLDQAQYVILKVMNHVYTKLKQWLISCF